MILGDGSAQRGADDGQRLLAVAAAELVPDQAADQATDQPGGGIVAVAVAVAAVPVAMTVPVGTAAEAGAAVVGAPPGGHVLAVAHRGLDLAPAVVRRDRDDLGVGEVAVALDVAGGGAGREQQRQRGGVA
ncbi:MAG: hypothetical protein CMQ43_11925 [Gammaproteobacteria bacterium]|nr:hypothetical protein [Gammaproteobacteria bacterium]